MLFISGGAATQTLAFPMTRPEGLILARGGCPTTPAAAAAPVLKKRAHCHASPRVSSGTQPTAVTCACPWGPGPLPWVTAHVLENQAHRHV